MCLRHAAVQHGALDLPAEMSSDKSTNLNHQAKAALGVHVRGKRLKPLMREYSHVVRINGPHDFFVWASQGCYNPHYNATNLPNYTAYIDPPNTCQDGTAPTCAGGDSGADVNNVNKLTENLPSGLWHSLGTYGVCQES